MKTYLQSSLFKIILCASFCLFYLPSGTLLASPLEVAQSTSQIFSQIAKKTSPAVVFIKVEQEVTLNNRRYRDPFGQDDFFNDEFFRQFFGESYQSPRPRRSPQRPPNEAPRKRRRVSGQGSGFIISKNGYILTNAHVVAKADIITVTLADGKSLKATLIGSDPQSDVALIQIKGKSFPYLKLGNSDQLDVGEWVLAIGNPFGLSNSLSAGIVSAKGRSQVGITNYENFIQTDAAINPGNSGGPLLNLKGEVIGMNTAIFTRSGGYMGIGFSIPINMIKKIKTQLQAKGKVTRGYLGVIIQELSEELASSFKITSGKGILVSEIAEDSPAEKYGLKQGDVIIALNGKPVEKVSTFRNTIALTPPKSKVIVDVIRKGSPQTLSIKIGNLEKAQEKNRPIKKTNTPKLGITTEDLSEDEKKQLKIRSGIKITSVKSASLADYAGLKKGQIILELNQKVVTSSSEFKKAIKKHPKDKVLLLLIKEGNYSRFITIKLK